MDNEMKPQIIGRRTCNELRKALSFSKYYHCNIDMVEVRNIKEIYTKKQLNKRRTRQYERTDYGYIFVRDSSGYYTISFIRLSKDGDYCVYQECCWDDNEIPILSTSDISEVANCVERMCSVYFFEKYGGNDEYWENYSGKKKLSIGEICEWYESFREIGLSINDIRKIVSENKALRKEIAQYDTMLVKAAKRKGLLNEDLLA
jgi:hypothetical protein